MNECQTDSDNCFVLQVRGVLARRTFLLKKQNILRINFKNWIKPSIMLVDDHFSVWNQS